MVGDLHYVRLQHGTHPLSSEEFSVSFRVASKENRLPTRLQAHDDGLIVASPLTGWWSQDVESVPVTDIERITPGHILLPNQTTNGQLIQDERGTACMICVFVGMDEEIYFVTPRSPHVANHRRSR